MSSSEFVDTTKEGPQNLQRLWNLPEDYRLIAASGFPRIRRRWSSFAFSDEKRCLV